MSPIIGEPGRLCSSKLVGLVHRAGSARFDLFGVVEDGSGTFGSEGVNWPGADELGSVGVAGVALEFAFKTD